MCFFRSWGMTGWNFTAHFLEHKGKKDKHRDGLAADGEKDQLGESLWDRKKSGRDACIKDDTDSHLPGVSVYSNLKGFPQETGN